VPALPPVPGVTGSVGAPTQAHARGKGGTIAKVVVGVVAAMIALTVVRGLLEPHYHVPDNLAGAPRLHNVDAQSFERDMASEGDKYDISFEAAVYGQADTADVFFVLANGHAEESADELFNDFLGGVESAGITVDRNQAITGQHGEAEYRCVPLSARIQATACIWREDRSVGMTLDASPDGDNTATLFAAYDATHA
jgi:hypothetical protein